MGQSMSKDQEQKLMRTRQAVMHPSNTGTLSVRIHPPSWLDYYNIAATKKDQIYTRVGRVYSQYIHQVLHYGIVPGIFALGLIQGGEFTLNPVALFGKIVFN